MSAKKALVAALVAVAVLFAFQEIGRGGEQAGAPAGIVFERNGDLYAIAVDGSRTDRLTNTPTDESTPAVSPDGRSIAFASDARRGIWIMGLHGRRRVRLTRGADTSPAWTPDGRTIYFVRDLPHFDGMVHDECGAIFRVDRSGQNVHRVAYEAARFTTDPAISPDGRRIATTQISLCSCGDCYPVLRVVDRYGRQSDDLAHLPGNEVNYKKNDHYYEEPTWSPDGGRLAFLDWNKGLVTANRDGTNVRRIASPSFGFFLFNAKPQPAWSPDGSWIAFLNNRNLWVVRPDGTGLRRLTKTKAAEDSPSWLRRMPMH